MPAAAATCAQPHPPTVLTPRLLLLAQACSRHPVLKALCSKPGVSPAYIKRRLKKVDPGFACGYVPTKPRFTLQQKEERWLWCRKYKDRPTDFWWQWVYVDEFTVYERQVTNTALHRRGDGYFVTNSNFKGWTSGCKDRLSITLAVNPYVGLVGYWWLHSRHRAGSKEKLFYVSQGRALTFWMV